MRFRNPVLREGGRIASCPGDPVKIKYSGSYDENGNVVLTEVGKEYIPDYIDSFRESCDINNIIKRYMNGDVSALEQAQGMYGDFASMPKSLFEMLNMVNDAENEFNHFPIEVKEMFGNSFSQYAATICDDDKLRVLLQMQREKETASAVSEETEKESVSE